MPLIYGEGKQHALLRLQDEIDRHPGAHKEGNSTTTSYNLDS
jgi:hypothetical protein